MFRCKMWSASHCHAARRACVAPVLSSTRSYENDMARSGWCYYRQCHSMQYMYGGNRCSLTIKYCTIGLTSFPVQFTSRNLISSINDGSDPQPAFFLTSSIVKPINDVLQFTNSFGWTVSLVPANKACFVVSSLHNSEVMRMPLLTHAACLVAAYNSSCNSCIFLVSIGRKTYADCSCSTYE